MSTENEPDAESEPEEVTEPGEVTKKREEEKRKAALECVQFGHIFYASRQHCARCFEPKPKGMAQ